MIHKKHTSLTRRLLATTAMTAFLSMPAFAVTQDDSVATMNTHTTHEILKKYYDITDIAPGLQITLLKSTAVEQLRAENRTDFAQTLIRLISESSDVRTKSLLEDLLNVLTPVLLGQGATIATLRTAMATATPSSSAGTSSSAPMKGETNFDILPEELALYDDIDNHSTNTDDDTDSHSTNRDDDRTNSVVSVIHIPGALGASTSLPPASLSHEEAARRENALKEKKFADAMAAAKEEKEEEEKEKQIEKERLAEIERVNEARKAAPVRAFFGDIVRGIGSGLRSAAERMLPEKLIKSDKEIIEEEAARNRAAMGYRDDASSITGSAITGVSRARGRHAIIKDDSSDDDIVIVDGFSAGIALLSEGAPLGVASVVPPAAPLSAAPKPFGPPAPPPMPGERRAGPPVPPPPMPTDYKPKDKVDDTSTSGAGSSIHTGPTVGPIPAAAPKKGAAVRFSVIGVPDLRPDAPKVGKPSFTDSIVNEFVKKAKDSIKKYKEACDEADKTNARNKKGIHKAYDTFKVDMKKTVTAALTGKEGREKGRLEAALVELNEYAEAPLIKPLAGGPSGSDPDPLAALRAKMDAAAFLSGKPKDGSDDEWSD